MAASVASSLDMTLDDVIKVKGKRGGGGGGAKGGQRRGGGGGQATDGKAKAAGEAPDKTGEKSGAGRGPRRIRRVTAAQALAPAAKAAAAAAKATAGGARPQKGQTAATTTAAPKAPADVVQKPVAAPKGTEEKLTMSLEDLLKFEVKKRKPRSENAEKATKAGATDGSLQKGGGRKVMKLRKTAQPKAKAKGKAKAKAGARGRARLQDDAWYGGGAAGWGQESKRRPGGGMYADWTTGMKRRVVDEWGPPAIAAKRMRALSEMSRNSFGWGRGGGDYDEGWGIGRSGGAGGWGGPRAALDRWGADYWAGGPAWTRAWGGANSDAEWGPPPRPGPRRVATEASAPARSGTTGCRIRVSNVPKNLDWRDIKEAFEDNGRVTRCEVERGVAWVTFESAVDAKKAVQTFDRGELNGQTIFVTHEEGGAWQWPSPAPADLRAEHSTAVLALVAASPRGALAVSAPECSEGPQPEAEDFPCPLTPLRSRMEAFCSDEAATWSSVK
eukprot:CAMPEP_0168397802 /NCGR_PEP_ID=MMETSP0228-20121227/21252_1 /TAXON_ID=133427 /ORGANISM="Protoceratium reticulatum, Strain CCCM 535 (=CCMP 1889)" /LENGTH=499 /DNA_ID=CAMNT_0008411287 /DNA_START=12 /DNA_END=1508 /DNA_ORIENTATION=-